MKRRFLVEIEVEMMDGRGPIGKEDLALYLETVDGNGAVRMSDVTVWASTEDYLSDLEDGYISPIGDLP